MADTNALKPWSALTDAERSALLADYQTVLDAEPPCCSLDSKFAGMQRWLRTRGVAIAYDDVRPRKRGGASA